MPNNVSPVMKYIILSIFSVVGLSGALKLILSESTSVSLFPLVCVCFLGLLLIFFGDQVDWFDLKNLKVKMRKIEETRKEIEEREARIKRVAAILADIAASDATFFGLMWDAVEPEARKKWVRSKINDLESVIGSDLNGDFITYVKSSAAYLDSASPEYKAAFSAVLGKIK